MEIGIYSSNVCKTPFEELEFKLMNTNPIELIWDEFNRKHYKPNTSLIHYKLMELNPIGLTYNSEDKVYEEAYQFGNEIITPEQMMIVIKSPYSYYGNRVGLVQEKSTGHVKRFTGNEFLIDLTRR